MSQSNDALQSHFCMPPPNILFKFKSVLKNAEFHADFKSVEKVVKKILPKT